MADEQLLTDKQVAEILNVSPRHVGNLAKDGRLPGSIRVGHSRRWVPEAIRRYIGRHAGLIVGVTAEP
jgi:excisionase family DNA binding protein